MLPIDRRAFIASLGGTAAVGLMSHEARADALEHAMKAPVAAVSGTQTASPGAPQEKYPSAADLAAQIPTRSWRRGTGFLFLNRENDGKVPVLQKMPAQPTLVDFFALRFDQEREHCLQSANVALKRGYDEEIILACLLHDTVQELIRTEHGWWGAQLYEPYIPKRTAFAIRYHQALRFYPDAKAGYEYPNLYKKVFGYDYVPDAHTKAMYEYARGHRWYDASRAVTVCDLYSFDPNVKVSIEPFVDIIGRHFKQPKAGLGNDNSAVAHMWRAMINPDSPL
jgi:hypothetical protein